MINSISLSQFKNVLFRQTNVQQNNNSFKFQGNNLKPLVQDTISFGSVHEYKAAIKNEEACKSVHNNAETAKNYFENTLKNNFSDLVYDKNTNPNGLVLPITGRVKTAESIQEKVADKIEEAIEKEKGLFYPKNPLQIKEHIKDIIGTRITMRNAHGENIDKIVDRLCQTITNEKLIIDEIENHIPKDGHYKPYFSQENLEKIKEAVNQIRQENELKPIDIKTTPMKTGYMALHLDVDLSDFGITKQAKNYHGELQILGSDVAKLKEVEDFCYKLKKGKNIKSAHPAYTAFETIFLEVYKNQEKYPNIDRDFEEYTKTAFIIQRDKQLPEIITENEDPTNWAYKYPTITECQEYINKNYENPIQLNLPPVLDFNILARIQRACDDIHKVYYHSQDILDGKVA